MYINSMESSLKQLSESDQFFKPSPLDISEPKTSSKINQQQEVNYANGERKSSEQPERLQQECEARNERGQTTETSSSNCLQRSKTRKKRSQKEGPQKVGRPFPPLYNSSKVFSYQMVTYEAGGWVDASKFLPRDYDLVYMKSKDKIVIGWHGKNSWDGLKVPADFVPIYWKKHDEQI